MYVGAQPAHVPPLAHPLLITPRPAITQTVRSLLVSKIRDFTIHLRSFLYCLRVASTLLFVGILSSPVSTAQIRKYASPHSDQSHSHGQREHSPQRQQYRTEEVQEREYRNSNYHHPTPHGNVIDDAVPDDSKHGALLLLLRDLVGRYGFRFVDAFFGVTCRATRGRDNTRGDIASLGSARIGIFVLRQNLSWNYEVVIHSNRDC